MDVRMARLEGAYEQIDKRLESLERHMDARFDDVHERLREITSGVGRVTTLTFGAWMTTMAAILGLFFRH